MTIPALVLADREDDVTEAYERAAQPAVSEPDFGPSAFVRPRRDQHGHFVEDTFDAEPVITRFVVPGLPGCEILQLAQRQLHQGGAARPTAAERSDGIRRAVNGAWWV